MKTMQRNVSLPSSSSRAAALAVTACALSLNVQAAFPTAVSSSITDSVTGVNTKVLDTATSTAMANLFKSTALTLGPTASNTQGANLQTVNLASAATTTGVNTLYSLDTASVGLFPPWKAASPLNSALQPSGISIPAEGFYQGAALLAFDYDGIPQDTPDFWVLSDEGFDGYRDRNGNLVLTGSNVRTLGEAESPVDQVVFILPSASVDRFFADVFEQPAASSPAPAGNDTDYDIYFGVHTVSGDSAYFGAYLNAVPEPGALSIGLMSMLVLIRRRKK